MLTVHTVHNPATAKVSRARAPPRGTCEILICAQSNDILIDVGLRRLGRVVQAEGHRLREGVGNEGQPRGAEHE